MIRGKKINFFIGYLNEDVFILLNTCNYIGLFVKVSPKGGKTIGWRQVSDEDIEDYRNGEIVELYNFSGGRCFSDAFTILEEIESDSFEKLDWNNTFIDPKLKSWNGNGWIDRDGKVYPCDWMEHDTMAYLYFKFDTYTLETLGWIRVNYDIPYCANKITQAQYNKCKELNIKVREEDVLWQ